MMKKRKRNDRDGIVCKGLKWFIKNINGCCEPRARINFLISHTIVNKISLYIVALDCKDVLGWISSITRYKPEQA
jgi:hypothetical protein